MDIDMIKYFLVCLTVMVLVLSSGGRVVQINDTHIPVDFNYIYTGQTIILGTIVRSILRNT